MDPDKAVLYSFSKDLFKLCLSLQSVKTYIYFEKHPIVGETIADP